MASEARRRGGTPASPSRSSWSLAGAAGAVAAGAAALAALYLRSPAAGHSDVYCYESVLTLAQEPPEPPAAVCFRVRDGRFDSVFPHGEAGGPAAGAQRLAGHAIPGLWDGHGHLLMYGEFLASVDLFGASGPDDVRRRLEDYVAQHPEAGQPGTWLRGFGWDQMAMHGGSGGSGAMPTADDLASDALAGLHIMLDRVDGHCIWVSRAVLALLPPDAGDVPGGEIVRTPGPGVFCDNAMDLVTAVWPRPGRAAKTDYIRRAMQALRARGLVGMHDAGVVPADLALYRALAGGPGWTLRVYAMVECAARNTFCAAAVEAVESDYLTVRSVKLFADGALGSWGSAMLEPYSDRPDTAGSLLVDAAALANLTRAWAAAGFQVNIHAIGDRANRLAVDALEAALLDADLCPPARPPAACQHERFRFRIEHAQIVHPHDQARMHALGLVASVQPTHATSDMAYAEQRLGAARTRDEAYRMRSFVRPGRSPDGGRLVLGSDFPIEPPDPFQGLYAAVARRSPHTGKGADGTTDAPWYPAEALTRAQALAGFTAGAAYGAFLDGRAGVIQAGAFADWVVLDAPLDAYDLEALRDGFRVRETWVGGRRVYKQGEDE